MQTWSLEWSIYGKWAVVRLKKDGKILIGITQLKEVYFIVQGGRLSINPLYKQFKYTPRISKLIY